VDGLRKITKTPRIGGIPTQIRTGYLPNTSLQRHHYTNLLDTTAKHVTGISQVSSLNSNCSLAILTEILRNFVPETRYQNWISIDHDHILPHSSSPTNLQQVKQSFKRKEHKIYKYVPAATLRQIIKCKNAADQEATLNNLSY
jgi:hypothetical protein